MSSKFPTTLLIKKQDGKIYDLGAEGIRVVTFDPPSPSVQHTFTQVGRYGAKRTNSLIQQTSIPLTFDVYAENEYDYELQRLKVMNIFDGTPSLLVNSRIPYLQWRVVSEAFTYPRLNAGTKAKGVAVNLVVQDGFAETVVTSTHLTEKDENFGLGIGLDLKQLPPYTFTNKTSFIVNNIGRIPLLANEHPMTIIFKGDAPNGLTITNSTTNQSFKYLRPLTKNDELKIVGLIPMVNNKQRLGGSYSSRSWLDFVQGNNAIQISGASKFTISFETRFYF